MDTQLLHDDETLEDLSLSNLKILQKKQGFKFGFDAVILSDFAQVKKNEKVCDMGTGTGILPLLLYGREPSITVDALEIQAHMSDMATRTMVLNALQNILHVHHMDLKDVKKHLPHGQYTLVISNPPYERANDGLLSPDPTRKISMAETECTLEDILISSKYLLKYGGRLVICLPAKRTTEALTLFSKYNMQPKRMRFVHANQNRPARLLLLEGVYGAKLGINVLPPLLSKTLEGEDTEEIKKIYHMI